jgi:hypothetical protein
MGEDGTETQTQINAPAIAEDGEPVVYNDMAEMNFKTVRVIMGPSYASKRQEAVSQLTALIQAMPELGAISGDIIARNMDVDGAEELAKRAKALLPPAVLQMEDPESAQAAQPPPDPMAEMQMQGAQQMMQFELQSANSKAQQEQSKAEQEAAKVEGAQLDNALKEKKLREPPPQRATVGAQAGSPPE